MKVFVVTYWTLKKYKETSETKEIRANNIQDAAKRAGYSDEHLNRWSELGYDHPGTLYIWNESSDQCAMIYPKRSS